MTSTPIARRGHLLTLAAVIALVVLSPARAQTSQEFFDDFRYTDSADPALTQMGWKARSRPGGPGCTGPDAVWDPTLIVFWDNAELSGDKVMGLIAYTNGDASGTAQSEMSTANSRFKNGTYAARIQFSRGPALDIPVQPSVQAFFTYSGHTDPCAESFSECDFEYVAKPGTFGLSQRGLYSTTHETGGDSCPNGTPPKWWGDADDFWHICMIRIRNNQVEYLVDGALVTTHAAVYPPESVMQIMFQHWFWCPLLADRPDAHGYSVAVDWVYYADDEAMTQNDVAARVAQLRSQGRSRWDTVVLAAKLTATLLGDPIDGAVSDHFGRSVAISGDTAIVGTAYDDIGSNADQGSVYVFERIGGVWRHQAKLTAADGAANDEFGYSAAISGDTVLVGAHGDNIGTNANQGSAYIFERAGGVWSQRTKLTAADGAAYHEFGWSVAISGDTAVVGAPYAHGGISPTPGSAYVFDRIGGVWSQRMKLTAADGAVSDWFGYSVAVSGETAVIGARNDDVGANTDQGSAYVFERSGGVWSQRTKLTTADGAANDLFGEPVAISGQTVFVGSRWDDVGANTDQGSAYVFERSGGVWSQRTKLTAADGAANDEFGYSIALDGDTALVGAPGDNIGPNANQGSAYIFERAGGVWSQRTKLTAADGAASDDFGTSIAISGATAVVGAMDDDDWGTDSGSAYVFRLATSCSADFNGDGFVDPLDYNGFINAFESHDMAADFNQDGFLDPLDYNGFINAFEAGC